MSELSLVKRGGKTKVTRSEVRVDYGRRSSAGAVPNGEALLLVYDKSFPKTRFNVCKLENGVLTSLLQPDDEYVEVSVVNGDLSIYQGYSMYGATFILYMASTI